MWPWFSCNKWWLLSIIHILCYIFLLFQASCPAISVELNICYQDLQLVGLENEEKTNWKLDTWIYFPLLGSVSSIWYHKEKKFKVQNLVAPCIWLLVRTCLSAPQRGRWHHGEIVWGRRHMARQKENRRGRSWYCTVTLQRINQGTARTTLIFFKGIRLRLNVLSKVLPSFHWGPCLHISHWET